MAMLLAYLACMAVGVAEESDVLVINGADELAAAVGAHELLLVEFYAPWCGHCKALAPEYAKAAGQLKGTAAGAKLAKCDATKAANKPLAAAAGVQGFPTMKLFKGDVAVPSPYSGGRQAADIVSWVQKRAGPPCLVVETETAATEWEKATPGVRVLGLFANLESEEAKTLGALALATTDVSCAISASPQVVAMYGNKDVPSMVLLKDFDEKRVDTDKMDRPSLEQFLREHKTQLLQTFSQEKSASIFSSQIQTHFLLFADTAATGHAALAAAFEEAAKNFRGRALHVVMPAEQSDVMAYFGLKVEVLPAAVLINMETGMKQYRMPAPAAWKAAEFAKFEESYFSGALQPFLKSAEAVEDADDAVKTIVGSNFKERVMDSSQDVLLMFYAPWCGHCKALAPKYQELGNKLKSVADKVTIAMIDATDNDVEHDKVDVEGFPTLKLFQAGAKTNPIDYTGLRETQDILDFVMKNGANKFKLGKGGKPDEL